MHLVDLPSNRGRIENARQSRSSSNTASWWDQPLRATLPQKEEAGLEPASSAPGFATS